MALLFNASIKQYNHSQNLVRVKLNRLTVIKLTSRNTTSLQHWREITGKDWQRDMGKIQYQTFWLYAMHHLGCAVSSNGQNNLPCSPKQLLPVIPVQFHIIVADFVYIVIHPHPNNTTDYIVLCQIPHTKLLNLRLFFLINCLNQWSSII